MSKIVINNEDQSFETFIKILYDQNILPNVSNLRCKKSPVRTTLGNKYKKVQLEYRPLEGDYDFQYEGEKLCITLERGECILTSQCRMIDYPKSLTVSGPSIAIVKNFVEYIYHKLENKEDEEKITIYQNNGGYWNISKQKKPRTLQSVIFKKQFISSVIDDVQDFIDSQEWYLEMGIPYKRSYLLFGPPGTGKSSFAQALAAEIKFSICFVNCSDKIGDFQFNGLLNKAPKKSIILIEDVDSIFSERKNTQKNNNLTFSGFLNAIDGVRSQEGRILMMTTNYKQRLDPALLRPGRVDEMYEIKYASHYQIERLCFRFFKDEELAKKFAHQLPQFKFSMSMIQGFLLRYRKSPEKIIQNIGNLLESDQNIKIEQYLSEINCLEVLNDFKIEECFTLAHARSLPKETLEKMIVKLSPLLKGRFLETIRIDRKYYLKSYQELSKFIDENYKDEELQRSLKEFLNENMETKTYFQIRDKAGEITNDKKE